MKDFEEYLRENKPEMPDEGHFLIETNTRLDAVEGIKRIVEQENRRRKFTLVATLVAGIMMGILAIVLVNLFPLQPLRIENGFWEKSLLWLRNYKEVFFFLVAVCATTLGIISMNRRDEFFW